MKLITISGLDGSGKSTQIELLKKYLKSQNKKFYYFHAVDFSIGNKFSRKHANNSKREKSVTRANWIQIQMRKCALCIDLYRFRLLRNKLSNSTYDYIISDRYFYDTIINIQYLSKKTKKLCAEKFIPKPNNAIYLKTSPESIIMRDRVPDQGLEYLKKKNELFNLAVDRWRLKAVDGNRKEEEIFGEIKNLLQKPSYQNT